MFGEGDFVYVFRVGLVAVDGFRSVWVFCWLLNLLCRLRGRWYSRSWLWHRFASVLRAKGAAWIPRDGRRSLEATELGRGVHLWRVGDCGLGSVIVIPVVLRIVIVVFVEGETVNESSVARLRCGSEVEYPDDLSPVLGWVFVSLTRGRTEIIDSKMKPAAAACIVASFW